MTTGDIWRSPDGAMELRCGDCLEIMRAMSDNSVDSVVTDPPYGLSFMGKSWDSAVPHVEIWREVLRVLKPGGHLLAFAGTRTHHRMATAIEDAGFEIRDLIAWIYGSGFPKSLDVSKAIDKAAGAVREVVGPGKFAGRGRVNSGTYGDAPPSHEEAETVPATPAAKQWQGWGTALKPAMEPITVARKPLCGTVADNVMEWGTGGMNIDASRVGADGGGTHCTNRDKAGKCMGHKNAGKSTSGETFHGPDTSGGRWPANLIHDGSDEVVEGFPETKSRSNKAHSTRNNNRLIYGGGYKTPTDCGVSANRDQAGDSGSAARFFYCAKASRSEREAGLLHLPARTGADAVDRVEGSAGLTPAAGAGRTASKVRNYHPTVKPVDLMRYLCRLVTPPGGLVLDPFAGSGTTGLGAFDEGFRFIGCEIDPEYFEIAKARIENHGKGRTIRMF